MKIGTLRYFVALLWTAGPLAAQAPELLPPEQEIELAESAAPPHVNRDASIYVLRQDGYVLARSGTNGFSCLVERNHVRSLEPICYDPEGTETILPATLEAMRLRQQGSDSVAIARAVAEGYRSGRFRAPRRTSIAYMLSPQTRYFDPATGRSQPGVPHLMFYAPYLRNGDIGSLGEARSEGPHHPFVVQEGTPLAFIVVLLPDRSTTTPTR